MYVDGYNLYYGGRSLCGRGTAGWRWLDIRALATTLVGERKNWANGTIERVVYCTARVDASDNPSGHSDQDIYLRALDAAGSVDHVEYGYYVSRVKPMPLAKRDAHGRPSLISPQWPVMIQDGSGGSVTDARFMVSVAHREEKGSDVNVASHLLADVLLGTVDAALVISNDSDLQFPIRQVRLRVPVGTVNPSAHQTAGALRDAPGNGAGRHFWRKLRADDFTRHQLPDPASGYRLPHGW
ncbi:MAG: NYN domain-containing protein [Nocardiopsaceae bacterium]|nr:NYN domain-containing protein [Nocardiopsaceae bacterium]